MSETQATSGRRGHPYPEATGLTMSPQRFGNTSHGQSRKRKPETLLTFLGGQGTINVNSWSPDSKQLAFVIYEPVPPR